MKKGQKISEATRYKMSISAKKRIKNNSLTNPGGRNKGKKTGVTPSNYKGEEAGYTAHHHWVKYHAGRPDKCENCGVAGSIEWANISGEYLRNLDDWVGLCTQCHRLIDGVGRKSWITRRKKMKIFLDVGYYVGKALDYYAPLMDETWRVYVFEPNTELDVESSLKRFSFKASWIKKAVWVEDGLVDFRISGREDASHMDIIRTSTDRKIQVPSIDFSKFVANLPKEATIICSFDGEGAEFPVLRKMLKEKTIQKITLLDIEFHHRLLTEEDAATTSSLIQEIQREGVLVKLKLEI